MRYFQLNASEFEWIKGPEDDPEDLCLHGMATAVIGEETIREGCTVSASALYFLKTLTENHDFGEDVQMFPCCGHFMLADETLSNVTILGCDFGTDLEITHHDGNIRIVTEGGKEIIVPFDEYREEVFHYADRIKAYYDSCAPKNVPEDEPDRSGYIAFWNEWNRRRGIHSEDNS